MPLQNVKNSLGSADFVRGRSQLSPDPNHLAYGAERSVRGALGVVVFTSPSPIKLGRVEGRAQAPWQGPELGCEGRPSHLSRLRQDSRSLCRLLVKILGRAAQSGNLSSIGPAFCRLSTYRRGCCVWQSAVLGQWEDKKSPCCVRQKDWQGSPAPALPSPVKCSWASALLKPPELRCHRGYGFATRHSRHRLGHHVREGRPVGSCTRPPIRVRGAGQLRPGCPGRDRERSGGVPGEVASWSRHLRTTLATSRAAPFCEEVPLTIQSVRPPPAVLSSRASSLLQLRLRR